MERPRNIFHRLMRLNNEDAATEILCNLLQFPEFKRLFIDLLNEQIGRDCINFEYEQVDTQVPLGAAYGRPDLFIESDEIVVIIENKIRKNTRFGANQPQFYANYLKSKVKDKKRFLFFLLPINHCDDQWLREQMNNMNDITCEVIYWEDLYKRLENSKISELNIVLQHYQSVLCDWYAPIVISLTGGEAVMLFSTITPRALQKVYAFVDNVSRTASELWETTRKNRVYDEYGFHIIDTKQQYLLWFGIWYPYWEEVGRPISIGIQGKVYEGIPQSLKESLSNDFGEATVIDDWKFFGLSEHHLGGQLDRDQVIELINQIINSCTG